MPNPIPVAAPAGFSPFSLPTARIDHSLEPLVRNLSGPDGMVSLAVSGAGAVLPETRLIAPGTPLALRFDREAAHRL